MSRWNAYLNSSKRIIAEYDGQIPLSAWLKNFFRLNKQMGSKDRKVISETVYNFYRLGHSLKEVNINERILTALFLCNLSFNELLEFFKPDWNAVISFSLAEKLMRLTADSNIDSIFPWQNDLSHGINAELFNQSFLAQPDLFLRIRPGNENSVIKKLTAAGIGFRVVNDHCIALSNSTKANTILELDKEAVVQDYNSQNTGSFFKINLVQNKTALSFWDCCAASGGKSIMAIDLIPEIKLTVSDIRESILHNLHQRFKRAGIKNYRSFITDLSKPGALIKNGPFDMILADLPCTGSGTWARTPEQLYFFDADKIEYYSSLQKKILSNIVTQLKKGGRLIYITCSVFKKENEDVVEYVKDNFQLKLLDMQLLKGYDQQADTMFAAVFES